MRWKKKRSVWEGEGDGIGEEEKSIVWEGEEEEKKRRV